MLKKHLNRKIKGFFFLLHLHHLVPAKFFLFIAHLANLSRWVNKNKRAGYTTFYVYAFNHNNRYDLFNHVIESEQIDAIDYLEFGVSTGQSFRWWMDRLKNEATRFYGFDTFSGLPEDWGPFKKGAMANNNEAPNIEGTRHQFYQGLFQQTLPTFLKTYEGNRRKIIHMDADLYSATLYTLLTMNDFIKPGDIIFFDEFNVPMHEFKALEAYIASTYREYEVLGGVNNYYQTCIKITR